MYVCMHAYIHTYIYIYIYRERYLFGGTKDGLLGGGREPIIYIYIYTYTYTYIGHEGWAPGRRARAAATHPGAAPRGPAM